MNKEKEIAKIEACINDLSYDKVQLQKAYNYYHCKRDPEQYRHIEDNYGIGTPTSVGFTPLIKKHIDVLVGEYLELDPDLQISCKDENTVSEIMRDKQIKIHTEIFQRYKQLLENSLLQIFGEGKDPVKDPFFEANMEKLKTDLSEGYVSEFEIAAQNILNFIKHSRDIDLKNKMRELLTDLLIGGLAYYRVRPNSNGTGLRLEILNPVDTFIERNRNDYYLNKSPRACYRKWMTKEQVLSEYWEELSAEAISSLRDENLHSVDDGHSVFVHVPYETMLDGATRMQRTPGILAGLEVTPVRGMVDDSYINTYNKVEVWECEWIDIKDGKLTRHEGVRIGPEIYITRGESEYITRSISNPKDCTLSINGIFFSDKNGDPFSIMLNTMDLQD